MRLFWYEIRKAEPAQKGRVHNAGTLGGFLTMPDNTFDLFFKYYRKSAVLHRCIQEIMETVGKGWYKCMRRKDVIEDKAVDEYLNFNHKFSYLKNQIIRDIGVSGNCFILKQKNLQWKPLWLQVLDPRTMAVVITEYGEVIKYIQQANGKMQEFGANDIAHFYLEKDPDNEKMWLSIVEGIITDVLADDESWLTNYYYFKNSAIPSQLIVLQEWMWAEERENAIEMLKKNFSWGKNKHKIAAVSGIVDIKKVQDWIGDMQFELLRKFTIEKVCAAYGVPKIILGYTEGVNYTSADTQYQRFIENTILTREERITEWINEILGERTDTRIKFDGDHINDFDKRVDIAIKQIQYWLITINEAREELWYELFDVEEANKPLITKNLDLLSDVWLSDIQPLNEET